MRVKSGISAPSGPPRPPDDGDEASLPTILALVLIAVGFVGAAMWAEFQSPEAVAATTQVELSVPGPSVLSTGQSHTRFVPEETPVEAALVSCGPARCLSWDGERWVLHLGNDRCDWQPAAAAGEYELHCREPGEGP